MIIQKVRIFIAEKMHSQLLNYVEATNRNPDKEISRLHYQVDSRDRV